MTPINIADVVHTPFSGRGYQEVEQIPSQPQPASAVAATSRRRRVYRGGFHTSICDIFRDPHSRTDCCAVTCCGIFSSDRNRFLLTGERPPPLWHRVLMYFVVPVLFIGAIGAFAVEVPVENKDDGDSEQSIKVPRLEIVAPFIAYIIFISLWGRWVRVKYYLS